jgi:hypothetical protein
MLHILEEVLPARFGGSPLDYQLLEEEDEQGFTRLSLLVSPRVALADENAALELIASALQRSSVRWLKPLASSPHSTCDSPNMYETHVHLE